MLDMWLRFFLSTHCKYGPGEDPFEAVVCTVGLPLKSHVAYGGFCFFFFFFFLFFFKSRSISAGFYLNRMLVAFF